MGRERDGIVAKQLRSLFQVGVTAGLTDGQLLERFAVRSGEEAERAFATLVDRHGPMVLRTCRGILGNGPDPHDAFQATFLILVRRGGSLWVRDSLGPWLHRVACRVAVRARQAEHRRRFAERQAAEIGERKARSSGRDDLADLLHEEIDRLPDRYRIPIVICDLGGDTHEKAAQSLGCPVGTVKSRLSRGRERLRAGLLRRGLAHPPRTIPPGPALALLPTRLADSTARAAVSFARGKAGAMLVPATVRILAEKGLTSMTIQKFGRIALALVAGGLASTGTALVARQEPKPPAPANIAQIEEDPAARLNREAALKRRSRFNLRTIALGLAQISNETGKYPPAVLSKPGGKPPYSWRVAILPFMGQMALYQAYDFDEAWDGPNNRKLLARMPAEFRGPGEPEDSTSPSYFVLTGPVGIFSDLEGTASAAIPDGASNTILVVESKKAVPWTKPEDIPIHALTPLPSLGGFYGKDAEAAFHAAFADGSVRLIPQSLGEVAIRALITRAGYEEVKLP